MTADGAHMHEGRIRDSLTRMRKWSTTSIAPLAMACSTAVQPGDVSLCTAAYDSAERVANLPDGLFLIYAMSHRSSHASVVSGTPRAAGLRSQHRSIAFLSLNPFSAVNAPEGTLIAAPRAFAGNDGVHVLWGVPAEDSIDPASPPRQVEGIRHSAYSDGAWTGSSTVLAEKADWGWPQTVSSHGNQWAIAVPLPERFGAVELIYSDGSGVRSATLDLPGLRPLATSTVSMSDGTVVIGVAVGPADEEGRLAVYLSRFSIAEASFSAPERIPGVLLRGFAFFKILGTQPDRLHVLWVEFAGGMKDKVHRADLSEGSWRRLPAFEVNGQIVGPVQAAADACNKIHLAFSIGIRYPRVLAGTWNGGRAGMVDVTTGDASSNPFFVSDGRNMAIYWFAFEEKNREYESSLWRAPAVRY
ncbi:MAG TPA: hypothetical protein VHG09_01115 [Longimicrobiales bacterium]|nr:hypothetical protein [Longimicrobiales bacterium]